MTSRRQLTTSRRAFFAAAGALPLVLPWASARATMPGTQALALAKRYRDELLGLLADLIRVQSLSGETAEDAQAVVRDYLGKLPYRIEETRDRPSRYRDHPEYMPPNPPSDGPFVNLVAWPEADADRRFAMFAHIDTHTIDDGWQTEPLQPHIEGRRIYGLGSADDKGGVAAMLVAARALAAVGEDLPIVMSLHGKGGGSRGSLPIFQRLSQMQHGINAVLYVHPAETGRGLEDIKNAVLGVVDLELSVSGWRAPPMEIGSIDSSDWDAGGNALDMCWRALDHLRATAFADVDFNLGIMQGGDRVGSVADKAVTRFRLKFAGENSWSGLLASARAELDAFASALPQSTSSYMLAIDPVGYRTNPGAADWDAPVSRILRDSIEDVTGQPPNAYPNHYAGDIRYPIRLLGVPAYGIGSIGGNFYGPNEWVDVDDLVNLVAVLVQTLSGWSDA